MSKKGIGSKARSEKQRFRVVKGRMDKFMNEKHEFEKSPVSTDEHICKHCNFKARYQFLRCPECNKLQE